MLEKKEKKEQVTSIQRQALDSMKAQQAAFAERRQSSFGDELEAHIWEFKEQEPFKDLLKEYKAPEILRITVLEIVMGPIIQLAETFDLGVAVAFAEKILEHPDNPMSFVEQFYAQMAKLKKRDSSMDVNAIHASLEINIAHLVNIFTFNYSLFALHSLQDLADLADVTKQEQLRKDLAHLARAYTGKILEYLHEVGKRNQVNVDELKKNFLENEARVPTSERWLAVMKTRRQIEDDARLAARYFSESLGAIEDTIHKCYTIADNKKMEQWIDRGLAVITDPNNLSLVGQSRYRYEHCRYYSNTFTQNVQNKMRRYFETRLVDIPLTLQLNQQGR